LSYLKLQAQNKKAAEDFAVCGGLNVLLLAD